jgi:hypothetical protein
VSENTSHAQTPERSGHKRAPGWYLRRFGSVPERIGGAPIIAPSDALPFIGGEDELFASTRGADEPVISSTPVTRNVLSALEERKVVAQTGVG